MSDNEDEPDTIIITHSSSTNDALPYANNIPSKNSNFKILILILLSSLHNFTCDKHNNKILFNFINLPIAQAHNQINFFFIKHLKEIK